MFMVGTKHPDDKDGEGTAAPAHNPLFHMDERALPRGAAFMASLALEWARKGMSSSSKEEL